MFIEDANEVKKTDGKIGTNTSLIKVSQSHKHRKITLNRTGIVNLTNSDNYKSSGNINQPN